MKRIMMTISVLSLIALMIHSCILSTCAVPAVFEQIGDADLDKNLSVLDATAIQRYLAEMDDFNKLQIAVSDINENGEADILDVTIIQRELAGVVTDYHNRFSYPFYYYVTIRDFSYSCDTEQPAPGDPVTFTAKADTAEALNPITYEYRIGDTVLRERNEDPEFTYTFTESGFYHVDVYAYNEANVFHMTSVYVPVIES